MTGAKEKFGAFIRREREAKEIGLREMAKMIGVSPTYLSKVERDEFPPPAEDKVRAIAKIIGCDADDLLARAGRVSTDITDIIKRHPVELAALLRTTKGLGVESGPGQPIDLAENFETRAQWHDKIGSTKAAADCRQAAAEIRRLRAVIDECQEAAGIPADQAENYFTVPALIADKIVELEDRAAIERRAGIEAAARYHDEQAAEWHELRQEPKAREYDKQHRADAAAIRALADKAPDAARKGG